MSINSEEPVNIRKKRKSRAFRLAEIAFLLILLWIFFMLSGRALRKIAIAQISELTNTRITTDSVDFKFDGSIVIEGLEVRPYGQKRYDDAILKAEKVYASFKLSSLLTLKPKLEKIILNHFVFNAQYDMDTGFWNLSGINFARPTPKTGKMPIVRLEGGTLLYSKVSKTAIKTIAAVPVELEFGPAADQDWCEFKITTAQRKGFGRSFLTGSWRPGRLAFAGGVSSADFPGFEKYWMVYSLAAEFAYDPNSNYSLKIKMDNLSIKDRLEPKTYELETPDFLRKFGLFSELQYFLNEYRPTGQVDIQLTASGNLNQLNKSKVKGKVNCRDISICKRKFPYSLDHLKGDIDFTENGFSLERLQCRHGETELLVSGSSTGLGEQRQYQLQITSEKMALDEDLVNALNDKHKEVWNLFSPSGFATINYSIIGRSPTDKTAALAVDMLGCEALYKYLPYPLKNITGRLFFDSKGVTLSNGVSEFDDRKIMLDGKLIYRKGKNPAYGFTIKANNIPVDTTLAQAVPAKLKYLRITADRSTAIYIEELTGRIWSTGESKDPFYSLSLKNHNLAINDDLFELLPISVEKGLRKLQPGGKVDFCINLDESGSGADYPEYEMILRPLESTINYEKFPYPLKDITGTLSITKDAVTIEEITAAVVNSSQFTPEASKIKVSGKAKLDDNRFDGGRFSIWAEHLFLDDQLGAALPQQVRDIYFALSPSGRFNLNPADITISRSQTGQNQIDFSGAMELKNCAITMKPIISEFNGILKAKGSYKVGQWFGKGQGTIEADTLKIKGKEFNQLRADINYDPNDRVWTCRNLIADCYDGKFTGTLNFLETKSHALEYRIKTIFEDIDLERFLLASKDNPADDPAANGRSKTTSGKMSGTLNVHGLSSETSSRMGRLSLRISDMQVGKLSPIAKLLYVLKLSEPKDFAFNRMLVNSYLQGSQLLVEKFDMAGEGLAFNGSGSINLEKNEINLLLTARGKRIATEQPSLLQSLAEGLGRGVVKIEVNGSLDDPQIRTKTLPIIKGTLDLFGTKPNHTD